MANDNLQFRGFWAKLTQVARGRMKKRDIARWGWNACAKAKDTEIAELKERYDRTKQTLVSMDKAFTGTKKEVWLELQKALGCYDGMNKAEQSRTVECLELSEELTEAKRIIGELVEDIYGECDSLKEAKVFLGEKTPDELQVEVIQKRLKEDRGE